MYLIILFFVPMSMFFLNKNKVFSFFLNLPVWKFLDIDASFARHVYIHLWVLKQ